MLIKYMLLVLVRVKPPGFASIRDKYSKKKKIAFLKRLMCPNTAKDIEKSAHDYYCVAYPSLQIVGFFEFF